MPTEPHGNPESVLVTGVIDRAIAILVDENAMSAREADAYTSLLKPLIAEPTKKLHVAIAHERPPVNDIFPQDEADDDRKLYIQSERNRVIFQGQPPTMRLPNKPELALRQIRLDTSHWTDQGTQLFKNHLERLQVRTGNLLRVGKFGDEDKAIALSNHRDALQAEAITSRTTVTLQSAWYDSGRPREKPGANGETTGEVVFHPLGGFLIIEGYAGEMTIEIFGPNKNSDDVGRLDVSPAEAKALKKFITKASERQRTFK